MSEYFVRANWTNWFNPVEESEHLASKDVLYLVGTYDISLFIGLTDEENTVRDIIKAHMKEQSGPVAWIEDYKHEMWYPWNVKVGIPDIERHDEYRLRDVVSLLIGKERKRGGCLAQSDVIRKKSSSYLPGLIVKNTGDYPPLLNECFEDTKAFTQKLRPYVLPDGFP